MDVKDIIFERAVKRGSDAKAVCETQSRSFGFLMPDRPSHERGSTRSAGCLRAELTADTTYTVTITDGVNMSYLAHYIDYVAGRGGGASPSNYVNIAEAKLLFME